MADGSSPTGSSAVRLIPVIIAVVVTGLLVFVACSVLWYHLGGGAWRGGVSVVDVKLAAPDTLILTVNSCHGAPRVSISRETDIDVQVEVIAFSTPLHGGLDCLESVNVYLEEPLGDRVIADLHSGQTFSDALKPYADAQPQRGWRMVEVSGRPSQPGFSIRLPFGWELRELPDTDSYVGEVIGDDGVRLTFNYGRYAWNLDPADDPSHEYFVSYEDIGSLEAKLLIPTDATQAYIGVYFPSLGGPSLSIVGENLLPSQRPLAIAVFRSVRVASPEMLNDPNVEYSMSDLNAWYESVTSVIWQVPGVWFTDLNEVNNRIEIGMGPRREAREKVEAAIATTGVPRGAIAIEIGCPDITRWRRDHGNPPDEAFVRATDYSLEVEDQVPYGETVLMKLRLRNVSDESVSFSLGGRPPHDFLVSTPDGDPVWNWKCGGITLSVLDGETLEPGEELEFIGEWEQVDNFGEPVYPGTYLVTAFLDLEHPEQLIASQRLEVLTPSEVTPADRNKQMSIIAGPTIVIPPVSNDPDSEPGRDIEAIYSHIPSKIGAVFRPLFGHVPADRTVIERLAQALDTAVPIAHTEQLKDNYRGRDLRIHYREGKELTIRQVSRCEINPGTDPKESVGGRCKGLWVRQDDAWWIEGKGMVTSQELNRWWEELNEFMIPIGSVGIPKTINAAEPVQITLMNWDDIVDGDIVVLSLEPLNGPEIGVAAFPVSGFFQGKANIPADTPSGGYWLRVSGGDFSELVAIVSVE